MTWMWDRARRKVLYAAQRDGRLDFDEITFHVSRDHSIGCETANSWGVDNRFFVNIFIYIEIHSTSTDTTSIKRQSYSTLYNSCFFWMHGCSQQVVSEIRWKTNLHTIRHHGRRHPFALSWWWVWFRHYLDRTALLKNWECSNPLFLASMILAATACQGSFTSKFKRPWARQQWTIFGTNY